MNTKLKEKMQEKAMLHEKRGVRFLDFMTGAEALYSELRDLVVWVDVNERLPEKRSHFRSRSVLVITNEGRLLIGNVYYSERKVFWETNLAIKKKDYVKFWRKIRL